MPLGQPQARPADAVQDPQNYTWSRPFPRFNPDTGVADPDPVYALVCEDCWERMPRYLEAPSGYVSPESNTKLKPGTIEGHAAVAAYEKVVCFYCYEKAVERTHVAGTIVPARLAMLA